MRLSSTRGDARVPSSTILKVDLYFFSPIKRVLCLTGAALPLGWGNRRRNLDVVLGRHPRGAWVPLECLGTPGSRYWGGCESSRWEKLCFGAEHGAVWIFGVRVSVCVLRLLAEDHPPPPFPANLMIGSR